MEIKNIPVAVYAESTPNPSTMKFVANKLIIADGSTAEFTTTSHSLQKSNLVSGLFNFPFITGVFIAANFISVTKNNLAEWVDVTLELRDFIKEYLRTGAPVLTPQTNSANKVESPGEVIIKEEIGSIEIAGPSDSIPKTEIEKRIVELLEEYIRPAVEQDGGAIHFKSFENGKLKVILRGSCSGCPSSTVTLKAGIQGLFAKMLPEVTEVVAEEA